MTRENMELLVSLVILIFSAILHEVAHGMVADKLGDPTARIMGRLTLDPRPHIDPMLSIFIPLFLLISGSPFLFGGAKPVPVDPFNLKEGRKDLALVALAGPLTNIALAVLAGSLLKLLFMPQLSGLLSVSVLSMFYFFFSQVVTLNLLLAIVNLIPVPPIDGSKIASLLMSEETAHKYLSIGNMGFFLVFILLFMSPVGTLVFSLINFGRNILLP